MRNPRSKRRPVKLVRDSDGISISQSGSICKPCGYQHQQPLSLRQFKRVNVDTCCLAN
ncbi:hypothetical protein RB12286 [Rhodopirellula baltica SH 1]|uniref:Uncharacterized protein n=1 Tax=Rhodopirellula baltica (strain DSM 10527 / NCIMB 13988 / SH1) TaxID=243090 RepID=Q7UIW6_RHOBA|nr:hypothetical protein RB12286 [Rhodopirellula baltica SH 1]